MNKETLALKIHQLANDLKSNLITWRDFDSKLTNLLEDLDYKVECDECMGSGRQDGDDCPDCGGSGYIII